MPKRNNEEKIARYQRKIQKLERQQRKRPRIVYSSPEETDNSDVENPVTACPDLLEGSDQDAVMINNDDPDKNDGSEDPEIELDPDILSALGEITEEAPKYGPKIHEKLTLIWIPILKKGIDKDTKEKFMKEYPVPENCTFLEAPKLNPEIAAAVTEAGRARDKKIEAVQQQLSRGITALNKGLELLLDDGKDRIQAIKFFSDSCRILCDLHHAQTEARKKLITPGLDKSFLNITQDTDRDDWLFGSKLSEKIKATKVIEKHGLQIKKIAPNPKTPSTSSSYQPSSSSSRSRQQGNWMGPPRFPSNRGGGGEG